MRGVRKSGLFCTEIDKGKGMEIIDEKQLRKLVEELQETVLLKSEKGIEYELSPRFFIRFFNQEEDLKAESGTDGYKACYAGVRKEFDDCASLVQFLKDENVLTENGATLISINGRFSTIVEYDEKRAFDELDMRGLLHKYEKIADSFVLVGGECKNETPTAEELEQERFLALKPYVISVTGSNSWHCTTTGGFYKIFRFRLTEETKIWLLQYKTDYDLVDLEDLAFYKGEKLLFSSCTHEGFHCDYSKDKK